MAKKRIHPVQALTDFASQEVKLLKHWQQKGVINKYLKKNCLAKKRFSFFDGPITANNPMGVHHGWGRTYKDFWQRYYNMKGYRQRFQNGFDCQGLWVEVEVEKELKLKSKKEIEKYGVEKFVQKCKDRVLRFAAIQTEQSQRLGYFMDWENSYYTMSDENNYMIWYFLKVCHKNGWLYKGKDSVPWCPRCETAISQHEILTEDYKELTHKAIFFALPIKGRGEFLLVWTTTPWTLPANIAVACDPRLDYALVKAENGGRYWLAKDAVERVFKNRKKKILKTVKGAELVGLTYQGPFDHLEKVKKVASHSSFHTIVASEPNILPVTADEGTGLVHTAVSAGQEDFKLGKLRGLPMVLVIDDQANYLPGLGFLTGKNAKDHPEIILEFLLKEDKKAGTNWVFKVEDYSHRYPICWRCKTELVWKVTDEWYIAMDRGKPSLRERMKKVAKKINWIPKFGLERELDWLSNMADWLISKKNRYWGLALPIWECKKCGHFEVIGSKKELKERVVSGWQEFAGKSPHKPQIDKLQIRCSHCRRLVCRIEPVGNPWLDAGIIPFSTLVDPKTKKLSYLTDKKYWREWFPADFITESFPGQFKNWFYSMIAMSTVLENTNAFRTVFGYATLLAEDGRPMHKSWGNAIEFNEGSEKIGVDVMRWLYLRQNPANNLLFGYKMAAEVKRQFHLLLWNSYRFFATYAAFEDWLSDEKIMKNPTPLDQWILSRLATTQQKVDNFLGKYDTLQATKELEMFVSDLSVWYIRRSRDRIGPNAEDEIDKQLCYSTLDQVLITLAKILAPFIPFISEQIYTNLTGLESVHLSDCPTVKMPDVNDELEKAMQKLRLIVEKGHSQRKSLIINLRQPLKTAVISGSLSLPRSLDYLIKDELNVKNLRWSKTSGDIEVNFDTCLTDELRAEGQARDLIRKLQEARKKAKCGLDEWVVGFAPAWPKTFENDIKRKALLKEIRRDKQIRVEC